MGIVLAALVALPLMIAGGIVSEGDEPSAVAWILIGIGVLAVLVVAIVGRAASAAFGAVLCRYAASGETSAHFAEGDLRSIAQPAPARLL
jgi:hypothetical protein